MKLKITLEIDYEVDGLCNLAAVKKILYDNIMNKYTILSEDIDGTDDYAILINSVEIRE